MKMKIYPFNGATTINEACALWRKAEGIEQSEIARLTNKAPSSISMFENALEHRGSINVLIGYIKAGMSIIGYNDKYLLIATIPKEEKNKL